MKKAWYPAAVVLALYISGCATPQKTTGSMDSPEQESSTKRTKSTFEAPQGETKTSSRSVIKNKSQYTVVAGDTLWDISSSGSGMSDPWLWPSLFRENRQLIEDPDLIYPGEDLSIPRGISDSESRKVKKMAKETPRSSGRTEPRPRELLEYLLD